MTETRHPIEIENEIIRLIQSHPEGILQSELWKLLNIDSRLCSRIVRYLIDTDMIYRIEYKSSSIKTYLLKEKKHVIDSPHSCCEDEVSIEDCVVQNDLELDKTDDFIDIDSNEEDTPYKIESINDLDLSSESDVKYLIFLTKRILIFLGFDNISAKIMSRMLIYKKMPYAALKSNCQSTKHFETVYNDLITKEYIAERKEKNKTGRLVKYVSLCKDTEQLYQLLKHNNCSIISEIQEITTKICSSIRLLDISCRDNFFKINYLPEYISVVYDLVQLGFTEEAAKVIIAYNYYWESDYNTLLEISNIDERQYQDCVRYLFASGILIKNKLKINVFHETNLYKLALPLQDIAKSYSEDYIQKIKSALSDLRQIIDLVSEYEQQKENKYNSLNETEKRFINSFGRILNTYDKITDNLLDLHLMRQYGTVRVYITELQYSNGLLYSDPLESIIIDDEREILLFAYYKEYDQYIVWGFVENYNILMQKNISIPLNLLDQIVGKDQIISIMLPSNAEVISVPASEPHKAILYWDNVKKASEDKWFI